MAPGVRKMPDPITLDTTSRVASRSDSTRFSRSSGWLSGAGSPTGEVYGETRKFARLASDAYELDQPKKGTSSRATTFTSLSIGLMAGPAVSL